MNTLQLSIPDISCGHCVMTVKAALKDFGTCDVDLATKRAAVALNDPASLPEALRRLEDEGFPATVIGG
ncbi:MAG TPA: heavy-metal-associated domain-containing protein [Holophagaceae bacterium]|nr:heavy-metal-associated domain-containing protein [Holophagaceae bacterium]